MIHSGQLLTKPAAFVLHCKLCGGWISGMFPGGSRVPYTIPCPRCGAGVQVGELLTLFDVEDDFRGKYTLEQLIGESNEKDAKQGQVTEQDDDGKERNDDEGQDERLRQVL